MRLRTRYAAAAAFALLIAPVGQSSQWGLAQAPPDEQEVEVVAVGDVTAAQVGEELTVGGRALDVRRIQGSGFQITFLSGFLALIPESHMHLWTGVDPMKRYKGRSLQVTGEIMEENEQLFIGVTDPDQMKVIQRQRRRRR
ncbi:MAG: hypothetical protein F4Z74_02445 [Acidobacteria bacterium]|nr:hypothetical protein [Acidobacteriota bacterium]MYE44248.1 hypothetical protein [Acidobacteriota bacterium]